MLWIVCSPMRMLPATMGVQLTHGKCPSNIGLSKIVLKSGIDMNRHPCLPGFEIRARLKYMERV